MVETLVGHVEQPCCPTLHSPLFNSQPGQGESILLDCAFGEHFKELDNLAGALHTCRLHLKQVGQLLGAQGLPLQQACKHPACKNAEAI